MNLSNCCCLPEESKGRLYDDYPLDRRSQFQRDRDRIIHSSAFRKLNGKTQVFLYHEGKNYRTRLTHSLEVAQITRTMCSIFKINEELGEAIALAHDLGHPPFGHAGESGLHKAMKQYYNFNHNMQSFKVVTKIESHYPQFEGLNLTREVLEGLIKHNGPITDITDNYLKEFNDKFDLELDKFPSLEAQFANLADDVAYNNHDLDDGVRSGLLNLNELKELRLLGETLYSFEKEYPNCDDKIQIYNITRNTISRMVLDILEQSRKNIKELNINSCEDIRNAKIPVANFSPNMQKDVLELKNYLMDNLYRSSHIVAMEIKSQQIMRDLFNILMEKDALLPSNVRKLIYNTQSDSQKAEIIGEYLASMTDMEAIAEHEKLFNLYKRF